MVFVDSVKCCYMNILLLRGIDIAENEPPNISDHSKDTAMILNRQKEREGRISRAGYSLGSVVNRIIPV